MATGPSSTRPEASLISSSQQYPSSMLSLPLQKRPTRSRERIKCVQAEGLESFPAPAATVSSPRACGNAKAKGTPRVYALGFHERHGQEYHHRIQQKRAQPRSISFFRLKSSTVPSHTLSFIGSHSRSFSHLQLRLLKAFVSSRF